MTLSTTDAAVRTTGPTLPPAAHFINGEFVESTGPDLFDVLDPATGELIVQVPIGTAEDVDRAVAAAFAAQRGWSRSTPRARAELLHRIADTIEANRADLEALESRNTGKPAVVAEDDVSSAIDTFRFMAGAARSLSSVGAGDYVEGYTSVVRREPLGVIGAITPWNYPLLMAAWKIAPALAGGNSVVLKPSEQTPLTTLRLAELIAPFLPQGVLNLVLGLGPEVGGRLAAHPDVALIALTGSIASGKAVAAAAAPTLKRVHLELGGKAPVLVLPDADLPAVASTLRRAAFWNSGQECGAACRVIVHETVAARLTELLVAEIGAITVDGPNGDPDTEIGPVVSRAHFDRVLGFLDRAKQDGATVAVGGGAIDRPGFFIAPTVLVEVAPDSEAATSEAFGPVIGVETYTDLDEAVARANATQYGLAASVWTTDSAASLDLPGRLDFGTVWVNDHLVLATEMPWGGFKGSGYGRDLSLYALDDFTRTKHVMLNHS